MTVKANATITLIRVNDGTNGKDGTSVKITSKSVTYQASTSGTTTPTGTWVANPPTVAKGQYLWTKTVVTYSDGNSTTAYSVAYQGTNGANGQNGSPGRGVKSTEVTYQAWKDGTSTPTGTWQTTVPNTTSDKPYLWTRTVITYTDNSKSTSYSVGSTPEGIVVGGRNLIVGSNKYRKDTPYKHSGNRVDDYVFMGGDLYMPIEIGETYVFQFCTNGKFGNHITNGTGTGETHMLLYLMTDSDSPGGYTTPVDLSISRKINSNTTGLGVWKYTIPDDGKRYTKIMFRIDIHSNGTTTYSYNYWDFKAERGNKATDWTPAPEDVDEGINNAQSSADKANTNASNAQQSADSAQNTANNASNKADQAKADAAAASSAAQIAKEQADKAQAASDTANSIANGAAVAISPIAQVCKVDSQGLKILNSEKATSYAQVQSIGLFVFTAGEQRAVFGATSKVENLAVQDYMMFGAHRAETKIEDGEEGTAFLHIGDVQ